jgi:hypothetical protein
MTQTNIFYAWQSDTDNKSNRYFIRDALKKAIKELDCDETVEDCPRLDHDTKGVPGTPAIADTIFEKIGTSKIFVADATLIGRVEDKFVINPNVAIELGYALKAVGSDRIILVMNSSLGTPDCLPFDLRHRRHPICYELSKEASKEDRSIAVKRLVAALTESIRLILKIPEKNALDRNLNVRVNPIRRGNKLLAEIRLFNSGPGPIYIDSWWIQWGEDGSKGGTNSIKTLRGKLPMRLFEQDRAELLVEIGDNFEELSGIGVFDGERNLWLAEAENLAFFNHQSIASRLPSLTSEDDQDTEFRKQQEILKSCEVDVRAVAQPIPDSPRLRLEVSFRNNSDTTIPIRGARLEWKYDPPRQMPEKSGKPSVAEISGSITLACRQKRSSVAPDEEVVFWLEDDFCSCLIEILRGDVKDEDISISIATTFGVKWISTMDEIPEVVRKVANGELRRLHM